MRHTKNLADITMPGSSTSILTPFAEADANFARFNKDLQDDLEARKAAASLETNDNVCPVPYSEDRASHKAKGPCQTTSQTPACTTPSSHSPPPISSPQREIHDQDYIAHGKGVAPIEEYPSQSPEKNADTDDVNPVTSLTHAVKVGAGLIWDVYF